MRFEIYKGFSREFWFVLKGTNGKKIMTSNYFKTMDILRKNLKILMKCGKAKVVDLSHVL